MIIFIVSDKWDNPLLHTASRTELGATFKAIRCNNLDDWDGFIARGHKVVQLKTVKKKKK